MTTNGSAVHLVVDGGVSVTLPLAPVPASRPRVTRWGTYYGKNYTQWMGDARDLLLELRKKWNMDIPLFPTAPVMVALELAVRKPKTGKMDIPNGDIDNFEKAVYDAMTKSGIFWGDDKQIVSTMVVKRYTRPGEHPHSRVWLAETEAQPSPEDVYRLPERYRESYNGSAR